MTRDALQQQRDDRVEVVTWLATSTMLGRDAAEQAVTGMAVGQFSGTLVYVLHCLRTAPEPIRQAAHRLQGQP